MTWAAQKKYYINSSLHIPEFWFFILSVSNLPTRQEKYLSQRVSPWDFKTHRPPKRRKTHFAHDSKNVSTGNKLLIKTTYINSMYRKA